MNGKRKRNVAWKGGDTRNEKLSTTALVDASRNALLLPLQRAPQRSLHNTLLSEGTIAESGRLVNTLPYLAANLCSYLEAGCISSCDVENPSGRRPAEPRVLPSRDVGTRRFEPSYPCICGDVEGLVRSLNTVLDDMNRGHNAVRLSYPFFDATEPRTMNATKLTQCLSCDLCRCRLQNPCTSLICLHSFCYHCIKEAVKGEAGEKTCPVPGCGSMTTEGFQPTRLGRYPLQGKYQCIVKDVTLATLITKFYGGETVNDAKGELIHQDRCLLPNRDPSPISIDDIGPLRRIPAKQATQPPVVTESGIGSSSGTVVQEQNYGVQKYVTLAVFPIGGEVSEELDDNYFYAPECMSIDQFCIYLEQRFGLHQLELYCKDVVVSACPYAEMTLIEAYDEFWFPYADDIEDTFTLYYRHSPSPFSSTSYT